MKLILDGRSTPIQFLVVNAFDGVAVDLGGSFRLPVAPPYGPRATLLGVRPAPQVDQRRHGAHVTLIVRDEPTPGHPRIFTSPAPLKYLRRNGRKVLAAVIPT